jgi:iron complex transport system substrate-binding protein
MNIVSLLPSATEMLFAIGAGDDVVGVTHECDFPPQAQALPHLTSSALPNAARSADIDRHVRNMLHGGSSIYHLDAPLLERLQPDLIVTQELCEVCAVSYSIVDRAARRLASDPRIVSLEPSSLEDVFANIVTLGDLTGHRREALGLVTSLRERIAQCHAEVSKREVRPRVLVLEWTDPPMSAGHWTPGLVELAGGIPVLGNPGQNSHALSWDVIDEANPDVIIVAPCGFDVGKASAAVADVPQLQRENVYVVDGNAYVNRPGPRLADTVEIFAELIAR